MNLPHKILFLVRNEKNEEFLYCLHEDYFMSNETDNIQVGQFRSTQQAREFFLFAGKSIVEEVNL